MSFWGKLHEISFYGLISFIICLITGKLSFNSLFNNELVMPAFLNFFEHFIFWASVAFIPIAIIGAIITKHGDQGEALTFKSDNILVIIFGHIAEEILGLFASPVWFIIDLVKHSLTAWKIIDYLLYFIELVFFIIGMLTVFGVL